MLSIQPWLQGGLALVCLCQISFGVVGGYVVYKSQKVETMRSWSLAARMGVEAMEGEEKS